MTARHPEAELPPTTRAARAARLWIALLAWGLLHAAAVRAARPPDPLGATAPDPLFSAGRAAEVLDELLAGIGPHPTGSEAASRVRERILARLRWLGYQPQVQDVFACGPHERCGRVRNVVARRHGFGEEKAVLLVAHYDSVGAGPGVSDDMAGVATLLEVARVVAEESRLRRPVLFLFTEGEEDGLIGASAFAREHPWMDEVGVVLNLEARGASGPSYLFETGEEDGWLLSLYGRAAPDPSVTSVSVEVYRRMPNDTDFTVFRERGLAGLNFAFIGDEHAYHTPLDDREHLSLASLQHHGDQVLATLRELDAHEAPPRRGDLVATTLFGSWTLSHGERLAAPLALLAVLGLLWGVHRAARAGRAGWWRVLAGVVLTPLLAGLPVAAAAGLLALARAGTGLQVPWRATPSAAWVATLGSMATVWCVLVPLAGRIGAVSLTYGVWVTWGLLGLAVALFVPGASFLVAWPALFLALLANAVRLRDAVEARVARIALFALALVVVLWAPVLHGVQQAFGMGLPPLALLGALGTLLVPLLCDAPRTLRRGLGGAGLAAAAVGCALVFVLPHQSAQRPAKLNLVYRQQMATSPASWEAWTFGTPPPAELARTVDLAPTAIRFPSWWWGGEVYAAPAPELGLPLPTFELDAHQVGDDGRHHVRGRLRSPAGAHRTDLSVRLRGSMEVLRAEGVELHSSLSGSFVAVGEQGIELELVFVPAWPPGAEPDAPPDLRLTLVDRVLGLPPEAAPLLEARPPSFVPAHLGDGCILSAEVAVF